MLMIAPVFKELSEEYGSRAQFIKVDVDDNPEAAQKYGVTAMPTFLFIKGGEVVDRLMVRDTSYMLFSYFASLHRSQSIFDILFLSLGRQYRSFD